MQTNENVHDTGAYILQSNPPCHSAALYGIPFMPGGLIPPAKQAVAAAATASAENQQQQVAKGGLPPTSAAAAAAQLQLDRSTSQRSKRQSQVSAKEPRSVNAAGDAAAAAQKAAGARSASQQAAKLALHRSISSNSSAEAPRPSAGTTPLLRPQVRRTKSLQSAELQASMAERGDGGAVPQHLRHAQQMHIAALQAQLARNGALATALGNSNAAIAADLLSLQHPDAAATLAALTTRSYAQNSYTPNNAFSASLAAGIDQSADAVGPGAAGSAGVDSSSAIAPRRAGCGSAVPGSRRQVATFAKGPYHNGNTSAEPSAAATAAAGRGSFAADNKPGSSTLPGGAATSPCPIKASQHPSPNLDLKRASSDLHAGPHAQRPRKHRRKHRHVSSPRCSAGSGASSSGFHGAGEKSAGGDEVNKLDTGKR